MKSQLRETGIRCSRVLVYGVSDVTYGAYMVINTGSEAGVLLRNVVEELKPGK